MAKKRLKEFMVILLIDILLAATILYSAEYIIKARYGLPVNRFIKGNVVTYGHRVVNNKYQFRERDFATPKPKGVYRIMVLGDSLTWGPGLAVQERYTKLLEDYLNKEFLGIKIEVLNFGLIAASTIQERDVLKVFKDLVEPDLIIVGFCLNDPQPKEQDYSEEKAKFDATSGKIFRLMSHFLRRLGLTYISDMLDKAVFMFANKIGIIPSWQVALQRTYEKNSKEWICFGSALREIKKMSDSMHLPAPIFSVLNQGTYADKPTDYRNPDENLKLYLKWWHQAEKEAADAGFKTCNFEKEIANQLSEEPLSINELDVHPSARLNHLYAQKLFQIIKRDINNKISGQH